MTQALGYRRDKEDFAALSASSSPLTFTAASFAAPASISHRGWRKAVSQGQVRRCSGAARKNGEEILNKIATGNIVTFSMDYAYIENQKACGLFGQGDVGATIDGSCRAARDTGIVLEEVMPQSDGYNPNIPFGAETIGKQHLIRKWAVMKNYDDCYNWLASGVGVILDGTDWLQGMTGKDLSVEMNSLRGRLLGGHARVLTGLGLPDKDWMSAHGRTEDDYVFARGAAPATDSDGRPYLDEENSHGEDYGDFGFKLISPRVIDYEISSGGVYIGISDMDHYGFRPVLTFAGRY